MGPAKSHILLESLSSEAAEWNYVRGMDVCVYSSFGKLLKLQLRHVCLSIRLLAWNKSAPTRRILMKLYSLSHSLPNPAFFFK